MKECQKGGKAIFTSMRDGDGELYEMTDFFFQAEDGIRDKLVTGVQTCALPILERSARSRSGNDARGSHERDGRRVCLLPGSNLARRIFRISLSTPFVTPPSADDRLLPARRKGRVNVA